MNQNLRDQLTDIVVANLSDENFGPRQLANAAGMSHTTLYRKLKKISGKNASNFIRDIRLNRAREMLLDKDFTIAEIAYSVGFGSATYFSRSFHKHFGISPSDFVKEKANPEIISVSKLQKNKQIKKIITLSSFLLASLTIFLFLNPKGIFFKKDLNVDKSIVVLPVHYLGDPNSQYQADGMGEEIKNSLSKIKDLRVLDKSAIDEYPYSDKSGKEIGKELNVGALLKITYQKENEQAKVFVKLINARDGKILFSEKYAFTNEGIFVLQNRIAQSIAQELKAEITPEEKERLERIPTTEITAYDFNMRGLEEYSKWANDKNLDAFKNAEIFFHKAIKLDSTYGPAYIGLGWICLNKNYWKQYLSNNYLDSVYFLANRALSFDKELTDAYLLRGIYFRNKMEKEKALADFNKILEIDPNNFVAYNQNAILYMEDDYYFEAIDNYHKAILLSRGSALRFNLMRISNAFLCAGFFDKATEYRRKAQELNSDSTWYTYWLFSIENTRGNYNEAYELATKCYIKNDKGYFITNDTHDLDALGHMCLALKRYKESLYYYERFYDERIKEIGQSDVTGFLHRLAYAYYKNGNIEKADYFFNEHIKFCEKTIELQRGYASSYYVFYDLAGVYAFQKEKEKAYDNLRMFNQKQRIPFWMVRQINEDPLLDNLRNEPEFQQILAEVEEKYNAEHERVKKWLEDNERL